jgi:hypothetical protein
VLVQQALYDPGWVGAVVGQITNDHPTMLLASATSTPSSSTRAETCSAGQGLQQLGRPAPRRACVLQRLVRRQLDPIDRAVSAGVTVLARYEPTS